MDAVASRCLPLGQSADCLCNAMRLLLLCSLLGSSIAEADTSPAAPHDSASSAAEPRMASSFYPSRQRVVRNAVPQTPHPSVVRISAAESTALAHGSGTLVGLRAEYGLVVTNWHVVRDARGPIVVTFPNGSRSAATVAKVDADWDLAALLIWRPDVAAVPISRHSPRPGDLLTIAGYGAGSFRAVTGRCTQYVAPGRDMPYEMLELSAEARQGDSGGPIFNEHGELAGVLFGAGGGTTSGSYCGRVRLFLESVWPAIDQVDDRTGEVLVSVPAARADSAWQATRQATTAARNERPQPHLERRIARGGSPLHSLPERQFQPTHEKTPLDLQALLGSTPGDQAKSILAGIGLLALFLQVTRLFSGSKSGK